MATTRHQGTLRCVPAAATVLTATIAFSSSAVGKEPIRASLSSPAAAYRGVGPRSLPQQRLAAIEAGRTQQQI